MIARTNVETMRHGIDDVVRHIDKDIAEAKAKLVDLEPRATESERIKEVVAALRRAISRAQSKRHVFLVMLNAIRFLRPEDAIEIGEKELLLFSEIELS